MNKNLVTVDMEHKILNTFKYYKQGSSVPSDGNCGLHAICRALVEGVLMTNSKIKPDSLMVNIFCMFDLKKLPNYWWSDEELAVIANYFGYDMYIYNEMDRTGIVFGKGIRPPLVLYSVENNSHWIPGKKTVIPSSRIPTNFTVIENISEVLSIKQITIKIKGHLLMNSLNLNGEYVESYSRRRNICRNVNCGKRVKSSSRRYNGSRSGVRDDGKSPIGRNKVIRNKSRDENHSGGRNGSRSCDRVRITRRDGSYPRSEGGRGDRVERSLSEGKKIKHSGNEEENYSEGEKGNHSEREEESLSEKNDESLLVSCTVPISDYQSRGTVKQKMNLQMRLKNTVLSKMIKQLCHWNQNKENKYKKLVLFDSEDEGDNFKDAKLDVIYHARFTIIRDILHHFVSKNERKILMLEVSEASAAPQPFEPSVTQFEADKYPQLEPTEPECAPVMNVENCYSIEAVDCDSSTFIDSCSNESTECCSNVAVGCCSNMAVACCSCMAVDGVDYYPNTAIDCSFIKSYCPFKSLNTLCNTSDCPFTEPNYTFKDEWVNENYVNDLFDSYALKRDKNMGVGLLDRVYNQTVTMSNDMIVHCFIKQKLAVKTPPAVGLVVVAPAMAASVVATAAVASPIMAAWVVATPELEPPVMQEASAIATPETVVTLDVTPPTMVAPEVTVPTMVTLPGNDLVAVLEENDHVAVSMKGNLAVASADNNPLVKPKERFKRYLSFKKFWRKKM